MYGIKPVRIDEALQRSLSLAYTSLASVLLSLRSATNYLAAIRGGEAPHVPWRDSPLTKWLQPGLSRATRIVIIGTVAPGVDAAAETLATLHYVSRFRSPSGSTGVLVRPSWQTPSQPTRADSAHNDSRSTSPATRPPLCPVRPVTSFPKWTQGTTNASHKGVHETYRPRSPAAVRAARMEPPCTNELDYHQLTTSPVRPGAHASRDKLLSSAQGLTHAYTDCGHVESAGLLQPHPPLGQSFQRSGGAKCSAGLLEDMWAPPHQDEARAWQEAAEEEECRRQQQDEQQLIYREVLAAIRKSGGNLREEALLEKLMHDLAASEARVWHCPWFACFDVRACVVLVSLVQSCMNA